MFLEQFPEWNFMLFVVILSHLSCLIAKKSLICFPQGLRCPPSPEADYRVCGFFWTTTLEGNPLRLSPPCHQHLAVRLALQVTFEEPVSTLNRKNYQPCGTSLPIMYSLPGTSTTCTSSGSGSSRLWHRRFTGNLWRFRQPERRKRQLERSSTWCLLTRRESSTWCLTPTCCGGNQSF